MLHTLFKYSFLIGALCVCSTSLVNFMMFLDMNKRVYNHVPGQCSSVTGIDYGAEDMDMMKNGIILVTSGVRIYANISDLKEAKGKMFSYNGTDRSAWEVTLDSKTLREKNFNPHGVSIFESGGEVTVFVVNHRPRADTVEVFRYKTTAREKILSHVRTVKSPLFNSLNDVVAVSKEKFYVTNFHYFKKSSLQTAELYMGLKLGSVVFWDGKNASYAQRWITTPSGLALDKSKKYLYVSALAAEKILIYKITEDYNLTYHSEIALFTSPDNLFVDPLTADLYVACHPLKSRRFRHESAPKNVYSPSQVLRIRGRPSKGKWSISQVYANDGATLSASSVAVKLRDKIVIGSAHDKMLACDLDNPTLV